MINTSTVKPICPKEWSIQWTLMTYFTKSYFVSGCTLFGLAAAGAMGTINVNLVQCLVFSALIVAVDPVAVSSLTILLTNHISLSYV